MNRAHLQTSPVGHARLLARLPDPTTRRDLRLRAGLSLRHLADEIGVTSEAVRQWEIGKRRPSPEMLGPYVVLLDELRALEVQQDLS